MAVSFLAALSFLFGWIYTICWSLSFYPQPWLNWKKRSTKGTTIDFPFINVVGFLAYLTSNASFYYSPQIRKEYAARNHGLTPTVKFNDIAFAAHAVVTSALCLSQWVPGLWGFEKRKGAGTRVSNFIIMVLLGCALLVLGTILIVISANEEDPSTGWAWIDVIYAISYVKVGITFVKYIPQVEINYRNKSTAGWSIGQILLDITGGILSTSQLAIDGYLQGDWSGITGNPVKLLLGNISIFFDVIFVTQHYVLYRKNNATRLEVGEEDSLLGAQREERIE